MLMLTIDTNQANWQGTYDDDEMDLNNKTDLIPLLETEKTTINEDELYDDEEDDDDDEEIKKGIGFGNLKHLTTSFY